MNALSSMPHRSGRQQVAENAALYPGGVEPGAHARPAPNPVTELPVTARAVGAGGHVGGLTSARNRAMAAAWADGEGQTLAVIAHHYGVSPARVRDIVLREVVRAERAERREGTRSLLAAWDAWALGRTWPTQRQRSRADAASHVTRWYLLYLRSCLASWTVAP